MFWPSLAIHAINIQQAKMGRTSNMDEDNKITAFQRYAFIILFYIYFQHFNI
jgi:hypothetical protein